MWVRVACSSPKASAPWLGERREKVSRSGLGWAGGNGPLLPAVKQGCQRLVHFCSPFICVPKWNLFLYLFFLSLFFAMRNSQVVFVFSPARTGLLQTVVGPRPGGSDSLTLLQWLDCRVFRFGAGYKQPPLAAVLIR